MLVSVSDLIIYMDISLTNRQRDAAEFVLLGLQAELEAYLRRPIESQEFTEDYVISGEFRSIPQASFFYNYSLDVTGNTLAYMTSPVTIYTRNTPILSVDSITLTKPGGQPEAQAENSDYVVHRYGIDVYLAMPDDKVTITYSAGLDGDAENLFKIMILRAATREMQNMHDDVVGVKDLNPRNVAPLETGFLEKELLAMRRWRKRNIG